MIRVQYMYKYLYMYIHTCSAELPQEILNTRVGRHRKNICIYTEKEKNKGRNQETRQSGALKKVERVSKVPVHTENNN